MTNVIKVVKTTAKRLKKSIPNKSLMQIQDIAAHSITGNSSFHELLKSSEETSGKISVTDSNDAIDDNKVVNWGEINEVEPSFNRGNWYFYPEKQAIVLEGTMYSPYDIYLSHIKTSTQLLDSVLQIQKKGIMMLIAGMKLRQLLR